MMKDSFSAFVELGNRVEDLFREADCDEEKFPAIAATALQEAELPAQIEIGQIAKFLAQTQLLQEPQLEFSDQPLVVFRGDKFYIQLLVWSQGTTAIHQHAFSGAFRVLSGSSIQTQYRFEKKEKINSELLVGRIEPLQLEKLDKGATRSIYSGKEGLIHSLFHLDRPSVSVVVRTYTEPWARPQYSYRKPHFGIAQSELLRDNRTLGILRFLEVAEELQPGSLVELLEGEYSNLGFSRLILVAERCHRKMSGPERERLYALVTKQHGELGAMLVETLQVDAKESVLIEARQQIQDPELRFFLALLLNAPDRTSLLKLVKEAVPEADPVDTCSQWLSKMVSDQVLTERVFAAHEKQREQKDRDFMFRIAKALSPKDLGITSIDATLRQVVAGSKDSENLDPFKVLEARLRKLPELENLLPGYGCDPHPSPLPRGEGIQ